MNIDLGIMQLLGAAQLVVFAASMLNERLLAAAVGSGDMSAKLIHISNNLKLVRISNLAALLTSLGIIVLGVLFYAVFHTHYRVIALIALCFFLAEALALAFSKIGAYALIPLSQEFVAAGAPENAFYQALGDLYYNGIDRRGNDIHMLFFCLGAILWYYLLYVTLHIPRAISIWGLAAVCLLLIPVVLALYNRNLTGLMVLGIAYLPFEPVLGLWLLFSRIN